jgi:sigma-B regulation protein RsbU (phosphoserine phosphatase)
LLIEALGHKTGFAFVDTEYNKHHNYFYPYVFPIVKNEIKGMSESSITRPTRKQLEAELKLLKEQQARDQRMLDVLYQVSLACRGVATDRAIFERLTEELRAVFSHDSSYIALCDLTQPDTFRTSYSYDEGVYNYDENVPFGPLSGQIMRDGKPLLTPDLDQIRGTLQNYQTTFGNVTKLSRTWMGVPLALGGDVLGLISLQSYEPNRFTEEDLELLRRIGHVAAVALENANLFQQQRLLSRELEQRIAARTDELQVLSLIAAEMVIQQPLYSLLSRAIESILPLFDVIGGSLWLYDREHELLRLLVQQGLPDQATEHITEIPKSSRRMKIVTENKPLVVESGLSASSDGVIPAQYEALLGVPLRLGVRAIGTLIFIDDKPHQFTSQQIDLAQFIANQLAIAIENARLLEERERQIQELSALGRISHAANTSLSLSMLLRQVYNALRPLMQLDAFVMAVYDPKRNVIMEGLGIDEGETYEYFRRNEPLGESTLSAWVIRNKQTLHLKNLPEEIGQYPELQILVAGTGRSAISWLGVPLLNRANQAIGVVVVQSYSENAFSYQDELFLTNVAQQTALHLQNMILLEERERQIRELDAIGRIGQLVSASFNLEEILDAVHATIRDVMEVPVYYLLLCEPESFLVTHAIFIENDNQIDLGWIGKPPAPQSLTETILRDRAPLLFSDLEDYNQIHSKKRQVRPNRFVRTKPVRSWAGVPLLGKEGEALGVLSLQHPEPNLYDQQTIDFLNQVASHVSLAVQKIKLFHESERQIRELDAIGHIGRSLSATFDLGHMLQIVYEVLEDMISASAFYMVLLDPKTGIVTQAFYIERGVQLPDDWPGQEPPADSLTGWILRHRKPLLFENLIEEQERVQALGLAPVFWNNTVVPRAWAGVPLLEGADQPIGVISVQDEMAGRYDEHTIDFLIQVAGHLSLGVQKVKLFDEREQRLQENALLAIEAEEHAANAERQAQRMALIQRVSLLLNSRVDPQETLDVAVQELVKLFQVDHVGIMLFDDSGELGILVAEFPPSDRLLRETPAINRRILRDLVKRRKPLVIESVRDAVLPSGVRKLLTDFQIQSMMLTPLVSRDEVIGSIGLDSLTTYRNFSEEEQESFMTIAATIAAAFENARLFAAEQAARRTADTLREVARVLSSTFDVNEILSLILEQLRTVVAYDSASILLAEGEVLRAAAHRGLFDSTKLDRKGFEVRGSSAASRVMETRLPLRIDDTLRSPYWIEVLARQSIRSWLGVPLIAKGQALGVLNIDAHTPSHFTDRDMEVAFTFANQAAVALENARLYQESVTRVEREMEIAREIQSNLFPRHLPQIEGMTIAARALPARETGGDFYDVVPLGEARLGLIIGDASGKSIPGAMLMAVARSTARSEARDHELPETVMRETNGLIAADVPPRSFVALSYATLDLETRTLALSNAGQLSPLRRKRDGTVEYFDVPGPVLPLGILPDTPYAALEVQLEAGDLVVFYTDGIVEAHNARQELFGFERLEAFLRTHGELAPSAFINAILTEVETFSHGVAQHDDMTLLVFRVEEA